MDKDGGGPAFPAPAQPRTDMRLEDVTSGMSLRDFFATYALTRLKFDPTTPYEHEATLAYKMADAMIAARKK